MVSTVFLTISWLALFLPPSSIAERLAIAMTILLTLTSMFSSERRSLTCSIIVIVNCQFFLLDRSVPRVSYVTCLDMWMVTCILFVFLELVEFSSIFLLNKNSRSKLINIIDKAALILLPVIFLVFNLWYWPYLLDPTHEDMDMWNKTRLYLIVFVFDS